MDEVSDRMRELGNRISRLNDAMIGYKKQQPPLFIPSPGEIEILLRNIRGNAKHLDYDGKQKINRDLEHKE